MSKAPEPIGTGAWQAKIAEKFSSRSDYLIPILQYVQSEEGWLSAQAMTAVARHLRLPPSKIYGVASFYAQFHFKPQGRNKLTVCRGTACHVRGSARIEGELSEYLKVPPGETTGDRLFTLESVACVGACALAPVVVINGQVFADQSVASVK
jgi:NADH-quinone oxidoreductase subunit E